MKIFWKIFLSILSIVTVMYLVFGGALLYASFNNSLNREIQREVSENKMFMNMLKTSLSVSVEDDNRLEENVIKPRNLYETVWDKTDTISNYVIPREWKSTGEAP